MSYTNGEKRRIYESPFSSPFSRGGGTFEEFLEDPLWGYPPNSSIPRGFLGGQPTPTGFASVTTGFHASLQDAMGSLDKGTATKVALVAIYAARGVQWAKRKSENLLNTIKKSLKKSSSPNAEKLGSFKPLSAKDLQDWSDLSSPFDFEKHHPGYGSKPNPESAAKVLQKLFGDDALYDQQAASHLADTKADQLKNLKIAVDVLLKQALPAVKPNPTGSHQSSPVVSDKQLKVLNWLLDAGISNDVISRIKLLPPDKISELNNWLDPHIYPENYKGGPLADKILPGFIPLGAVLTAGGDLAIPESNLPPGYKPLGDIYKKQRLGKASAPPLTEKSRIIKEALEKGAAYEPLGDMYSSQRLGSFEPEPGVEVEPGIKDKIEGSKDDSKDEPNATDGALPA